MYFGSKNWVFVFSFTKVNSTVTSRQYSSNFLSTAHLLFLFSLSPSLSFIFTSAETWRDVITCFCLFWRTTRMRGRNMCILRAGKISTGCHIYFLTIRGKGSLSLVVSRQASAELPFGLDLPRNPPLPIFLNSLHLCAIPQLLTELRWYFQARWRWWRVGGMRRE